MQIRYHAPLPDDWRSAVAILLEDLREIPSVRRVRVGQAALVIVVVDPDAHADRHAIARACADLRAVRPDLVLRCEVMDE